MDVFKVLVMCSLGLNFDRLLLSSGSYIFLVFDAPISELVKCFQLACKVETAFIVVDGIFDLADSFLKP